MDGTLISRHARLLAKLKARTTRDGFPKRHYEENVASLRAELDMIEEAMRGA
jgi:hypothetical protein